MALPANLVVENGAFYDSKGDDAGVAARIKCIAPIGYGDVTPANWDPAVTKAIDLLTLELDAGTTVDPDDALSSGTIVITDTMTLADLQALVNATTYWRMTLVGGLPTDLLQTDGTIDFVDLTADKDCATEIGSALCWDVSVVEEMNNSVCIENGGIGFGPFTARHTEITAPLSGRETPDAVSNPAEIFNAIERVNFLSGFTAECTFGSGAAAITVYGVLPDGTTRTLYTEAVTTTETAQSKSFTDPLVGLPGERIIVNVAGAEVTAVTELTVMGGWGRLRR